MPVFVSELSVASQVVDRGAPEPAMAPEALLAELPQLAADAPTLAGALRQRPELHDAILGWAAGAVGNARVNEALAMLAVGDAGASAAAGAAGAGAQAAAGGAAEAAVYGGAQAAAGGGAQAAAGGAAEAAVYGEAQAAAGGGAQAAAGGGAQAAAGAGAQAAAASEPAWVAGARQYNALHAEAAARFDEATDGACRGDDGALEPVAIVAWQTEHGLHANGRVTPETLAEAGVSVSGGPATATARAAAASGLSDAELMERIRKAKESHANTTSAVADSGAVR